MDEQWRNSLSSLAETDKTTPRGQAAWVLGVRVWVPPGRSSEGMYCRTGAIKQAMEGGALVKHDNGSTFGWGWTEIAPIAKAPWYWRWLWVASLIWVARQQWGRLKGALRS